ncbi:hypothetical protein [Micromonospora sp. CA-244673]|uniref:hypothetical protein n=1 Tax=Micromonospora sp. CA-244673 TaxID=3239958 RepID=UPI003D91FC69
MDTSDRSARGAAMAFDVAFAVAALLGTAFTAYMISDSWGGGYAVPDTAVAAVVSLLALGRRINRTWTAVAGLAVVAMAVLGSQVADLPQEPSPIASLALAVLIGSALRHLPATPGRGIAAGGLAVILACWVTGGFRAVAVLGTLAWLAAVTVGASMRGLDAGRRVADKRRRAAEEANRQWDPSRGLVDGHSGKRRGSQQG